MSEQPGRGLQPVSLVVNGELRVGLAEPRTLLSDFLREDLHLTGTKRGCETGTCGACSVLIDGRLVKSCLDDLGSHDKAVVVTLNPDDLQRLQALQIETQSELRLDPDPTLLPGSVRVRAHDAEIQDFIDHRLEALARRLLSDPEAWLKKSSLLHPHEVEPLPDDTPKRRGRPPKSGEAATARVHLRLTKADRAKYDALGGVAWLRQVLRRAKITASPRS